MRDLGASVKDRVGGPRMLLSSPATPKGWAVSSGKVCADQGQDGDQEAMLCAEELSLELPRARDMQGPTCNRCSVTGMAFSSCSSSMAPS